MSLAFHAAWPALLLALSACRGSDPGACDGALAELEAPYAADVTNKDIGGFAVDERGLVFTALRDAEQVIPGTAYTSSLRAVTSSGELSTLYMGEGVLGPFALAGDAIYAITSPFLGELVRLPRAGGEPTVVIDETFVATGPIPGEPGKLYYSTREPTGAGARERWTIFELDAASGESAALASGEGVNVLGIAFDRGLVYWLVLPQVSGDYDLYRVPASGGSPEIVRTLPRRTPTGNFKVVDGVVFGSGLRLGVGAYEIYRAPPGQDSELVVEDGGVPLAIVDGSAYYGSRRGGLVRSDLAFEASEIIAGSGGKDIRAVAAGPDALWYATEGCIYRVEQ